MTVKGRVFAKSNANKQKSIPDECNQKRTHVYPTNTPLESPLDKIF